jgi:hypothetical protein
MYFLCRLIPPRPSFAMDMKPPEAKAMNEHVAYWTDLLGKGKAIAFGTVMDSKGPWGVGLVSVRDQAELRDLQANDPAPPAGKKKRRRAGPRLFRPLRRRRYRRPCAGSRW